MSGILEMKSSLSEKKISESELVGECKRKAESSTLNAYITLTEDKNECRGAFSGIPFAVKDNISTKGVLTTCASEMLSNYVPIFDAYAVECLKNEGAVMVGKTNMDEFGIGSSGETSFYGAVKNPWDVRRAAGGSSSGSATAVAEGTAAFALGTDTGGSVRLPAAYCSVIGLAPTYSLVSRYGLIPYASSLDRIGIITKNARDAALVLDKISGFDVRDMTCSKNKYVYLEDELCRGVNGRKIGVFSGLFSMCSHDVTYGAEKAIGLFSSLGAKINSVEFPFLKEALSAYKIISAAEAASNLSRYDGVRYGKRADGENYDEIAENTRNTYFGEAVKRKIISGCFFSSDAGKEITNGASRIRMAVTNVLDKLLEENDILLLPTAKSLPPILGEGEKTDTDIFTVISSLSGNPSITVPLDKMTGIQIIGRKFAEGDILSAAHALEEAYHGF